MALVAPLRFAIMVVFAGAMGCAADSATTEPPTTVETIAVTPGIASLSVGQTAQASAIVRSALGNELAGIAVNWASSNAAIATVSQTGLITAVAPGTASITASVNGKSGFANITVVAIPVAAVIVALSTPVVVAGQPVTATATTRDANGGILADRVVAWQSSNSSVASISSAGIITTIAAGTTSIVATSEGITGSAPLTVQPAAIAVSSIGVALSKGTLLPSEAATATATPRDASNNVLAGRTVAWSSSNSTVATIDANGSILAVTPGTTTISAASEGVTGSAALTVAPVVASVTVSLPAAALTVGKTAMASVVLRDANNAVISGRAVTWRSSNTSIATVSAAGLVSGIAPGQVTITATNDGQAPSGASAASASSSATPVSGSTALTIQVAAASVVVTLGTPSIPVGQSTTATAVVKDAGNNVLTRTITWTSTNPGVASVDATGKVTGLAAGTSNIAGIVDDASGFAVATVTTGTAGTAARLGIVTQPDGAVSGQTFATPAVVAIRDAAGVVVTTASSVVTATVASGSGSITAGGQATASNGLATFSALRISGTGPHTLMFSASGLTSATSSAFTIAAPALVTTVASATVTGTANAALAAVTPVTASGGTPPYSFALSGGTLPSGLTFNTTSGQLSGTPSSALATTTFTVTVTDAASATSSKTFQLTINAAVPALVTTQAVPSVTGTVNTAIAAFTPVTASGGTPPYTFALSGGTLPSGMSFSTTTGQVSGTPTATLATTTFTVTVTDAATKTSAKTFQLTVNGGGSTANECATPKAGWIFCDDFETDRTASYFEYDNAGGKYVRAASAGYRGSVGMRATYTTGQANAGALHLAFGRTPGAYFRPADAGTANYRELYWRFYVYRQPGWVGNGPDKLTRAIMFAKSDFSEAMIAHVWSSSPDHLYLVLDPASGTDVNGNLVTVGYNDFANLRWLGGTASAQTEEDQAHVGIWACYEFHVKLNDAGQSNGLFEFTVNGQSSARHTGLNWVGSYNAFGINALYIENYQNDGAPAANVRVVDNLVVSTQPIGCLP